jgi:TetR/AcrR family transcriptional regulator, regulator of mycofactocin system
VATTRTAGTRRNGGRRPVTSRDEIEHIALDLFADHGFEHTTVDDIATAAGIGRRTVFRYYPSKNDIPWGAFDEQLDRMRRTFDELPDDLSVLAGVRVAVLDANDLLPDELPWLRRRLALIVDTPALQAHSTLRYAAWRGVVAEYAGRRLGVPPDALLPRAIGHASLGVALAAYERWLDHGGPLHTLLDEAFRALETGLDRTAQ